MKTYRIEITDEETNVVVQRAAGIPEEKMQTLLRLIGQIGQVASDFQRIRNAWNLLKGKGNE